MEDHAAQAAAAVQQPVAAPPAEGDAAAPVAPPEPPAAGEDQVAVALPRIAAHIGRASKFCKASELLRKVLSEGSVQRHHAALVFDALRAAMVDPARAAEPALRREYLKLFEAASQHAELFDPGQLAQLEVYYLWAVARNQMGTDDSFLFNRVVGRIKGQIAELPEATEGEGGAEDAALRALGLSPQGAAVGVQHAQQQPTAAVEAGAHGQEPQGRAGQADVPHAAAAPAEPVGGGAADEGGPGPAASAAPSEAATWGEAELLLASRRAALLACLCAGRDAYRQPWAAVSVDLLVDQAARHAPRFAPCQRPAVAGMVAFVKDRRAARRLGPSAKEAARDSTSFDRARAEWGRAAVSARGKVGGSGDRKADQWLG